MITKQQWICRHHPPASLPLAPASLPRADLHGCRRRKAVVGHIDAGHCEVATDRGLKEAARGEDLHRPKELGPGNACADKGRWCRRSPLPSAVAAIKLLRSGLVAGPDAILHALNLGHNAGVAQRHDFGIRVAERGEHLSGRGQGVDPDAPL